VDQSSLSVEVRQASADQVNRALRRSALVGIPASSLLALILGSSVPLPRRLAFVAFVWVADVVMFSTSGWYLRRRRRGELIDRYWQGPSSACLLGLAWGALAVIALPSARHADLRSVCLLFACATSASYTVGTAARRLYFYACQVPLLFLTTIAFVASGDRASRLFGLAIPIYFGLMATMHNEVHALVVSELQLRERNEETNGRLREQAMRDSLTGLANRGAFVEQLERAIASARRDQTLIGVLYFDLDHFKFVNDSLGHGAGDELLVEVAARVRSVMRSQDLLARLGGDEFTMLLDRLSDSTEAVLIAGRVLASFAEPFDFAGRRHRVSASIGIATNIDTADSAEMLLSNADAALYRAKQGGRNRVETYDADLGASVQRRLDDEQDLREALANNQIEAWFQPEVDLETGRIVGAEALARWIHPTRGVIDAADFMPLAGDVGLVFAIDDRVVASAVELRAGLMGSGIDGAFRIWCNVSAGQLGRVRPTERLIGLLQRTGCDPTLIGIEITETAVLADVAAAARELAAARSLGIKVALDDFGTGHSSLTLLHSLPMDRVKIDRSFVRELSAGGPAAAIVRSVLTLGQDLGLDVVAEGVETIDQMKLLRELGCRYAQGYLFARVLPIDELTRRLYAQQLGSIPAAPVPLGNRIA
jgi:diguanylate cyclase (GGDEF)-like protein